jgi:glycine betaine/choline ABC-type transport system substrate-binding protein
LRDAITAGGIDIYPEYTGNGAFFFSDEANNTWGQYPKKVAAEFLCATSLIK